MTLFGMFGGNKEKDTAQQASAASSTAPGTAISFDPVLIGRLTQDHRHLVDIYKKIHTALEHKDVNGIRAGLLQFRDTLQAHLLLENVKLYIYLAHRLAGNEDSSQIVHDMRREMMGIGRVVMDFLRKYTEAPISPAQLPAFKTELDGIGAALVNRIEREEGALYPLYLPSY